jgi:hypothetical protein
MMESLKESRKGITTKAGLEMASNKYQRDNKKADLNDDGKLNSYEQARADAIQQAMVEDDPEQDDVQMYHGGMACGGDEGLMMDPMSGNEIPIGSSAENVRDDIDIKISEGEYVLPADVVKWHGLKSIMDMEAEAKMGLMGMYQDGLIQYVDQEGSDRMTCPECDGEGCDHCDGKGYHDAEETQSDSEDSEDASVQAEDDSEQEEKEVIETPEGNEIELAGVETEETVLEPEYPEEGDEGYYPSQNREYAEMKKPIIKFII